MKYCIYVIGLFILTLGISLTIQSSIGTSPFDALLVGMSRNIGLTVGSWEIIIGVVLLGCNALIKKQKPEILGLVTAFITGIGIDMWLFLFSHILIPELWYTKAICFGIGLMVVGLGTAIYLYTNFAAIPVDRSTLILQELTGKSIFFARTTIYLIFLILALIFGGPIGIGTVLSVCFGGIILNFFMPLTKKMLKPILVVPVAASEQKA